MAEFCASCLSHEIICLSPKLVIETICASKYRVTTGWTCRHWRAGRRKRALSSAIAEEYMPRATVERMHLRRGGESSTCVSIIILELRILLIFEIYWRVGPGRIADDA